MKGCSAPPHQSQRESAHHPTWRHPTNRGPDRSNVIRHSCSPLLSC